MTIVGPPRNQLPLIYSYIALAGHIHPVVTQLVGGNQQCLVIIRTLSSGQVVIFHAESLAKGVGSQARDIDYNASLAHFLARPIGQSSPVGKQVTGELVIR